MILVGSGFDRWTNKNMSELLKFQEIISGNDGAGDDCISGQKNFQRKVNLKYIVWLNGTRKLDGKLLEQKLDLSVIF